MSDFKKPNSISAGQRKAPTRYSTGIFGKAVLRETIDMLPELPDTDSLNDVRKFLCANLRFSAEQTRQRNANYIIKRMFHYGYADKPLKVFAKSFPDTTELRDVCFYRFLRAERLQLDIIEELLLPNIGIGTLSRASIRAALKERFPESRSIIDGTSAIVDALRSCDIALTDSKNVSFAYRDISPVSFAFVLHSEFSDPGIYNINDLEENRFIKALLWNPDRIMYTLYELRNQGLISKVSEIDSIRQFSTKYTLDEAVARLTN